MMEQYPSATARNVQQSVGTISNVVRKDIRYNTYAISKGQLCRHTHKNNGWSRQNDYWMRWNIQTNLALYEFVFFCFLVYQMKDFRRVSKRKCSNNLQTIPICHVSHTKSRTSFFMSGEYYRTRHAPPQFYPWRSSLSTLKLSIPEKIVYGHHIR